MPPSKNAGSYRFGYHRVGLSNVGSYQVAGHPFITGSRNLLNTKVHMVEFPYVSSQFTVINQTPTSEHYIRVHFSSGSGIDNPVTSPGAGGAQTFSKDSDVYRGDHWVTLSGSGDSVTFHSKCTKFYISNIDHGGTCAYQVIADLTNIPAARMYHLTGSGITGPGYADK